MGCAEGGDEGVVGFGAAGGGVGVGVVGGSVRGFVYWVEEWSEMEDGERSETDKASGGVEPRVLLNKT